MANWSNVMVITPSEELQNIIQDCIDKFNEADGIGLLLRHEGKDIDESGRYIFQPQRLSEDTFIYETKWSPNISDIELLARKLKAPFTLSAEEFGVDDNYYLEFDGEDYVCELSIQIFDYCEADEENCGVVDNQTGEYWDSESDYFWHLIDLSKQGVL